MLSVKGCHEWAARRLFRLFEESHSGLLGQPVALPAVATNARDHNVFPSSASTAVSGNHMVHIQFLYRKVLSAILALVFVTFQQVLPIELHFLHQRPVVSTQDQNARHQNFLANCINHSRSRTILQILAIRKPGFAIKHSKTSILCKNHLGMVERQQTECPFYSDYVHRLPKAVQNECLITSVHPPWNITVFPPAMSKNFSSFSPFDQVTEKGRNN